MFYQSNIHLLYPSPTMKKLRIVLLVLTTFLAMPLLAQTVFPGKQTISKKEYFGLNLNTSIPDRYLGTYWEEYLNEIGKAKSRRGVYTVDKANLPGIADKDIEMTSQISTSRNVTQLFLAVNINGKFVSNFTDDTYKATEQFLKDFSSYAVARDEVRIAEEYYADAEKNHDRLQRDNERIIKEIERTQKKLEELAKEQETNKTDLAGSVIDLENKQKALELAKSRIPKK